jgi:predicted RNA-binding Zn-ribbon protein involved in translation (DUF1610 family)
MLLDIETSPCLADVWGLWNQNVGLNQLRESAELLCFAAKWLGDPARQTRFVSGEYDPRHPDGQFEMVQAAHDVLDEADAVVTWNGRKFDIPHLNREFLEYGLKPPSPYRQIDMCDAVKRQFRFPSNKLQYVSTQLGLSGKVSHEGHGLWVKVMAGDEPAWKRFERYNKQDVILLDGLYGRLQPWIPGHPSHAAMAGQNSCPKCGSDRLQRRGLAYTLQSAYQRYQCRKCGAWSRSTKRESGTTIREVANA